MNGELPAKLVHDVRTVIDHVAVDGEELAARHLSKLITEHGSALVSQALITVSTTSLDQLRRQLPAATSTKDLVRQR